MLKAGGAKPWMAVVLRVAGVYNICWGIWAVLFPSAIFTLAGLPQPNYPELWQCVGMIVGVYGVAYWAAARDPLTHWPVVLAGLLGKVFGPIGFLRAAFDGRLAWKFGWVNVANDVIWWIPFTLILLASYRAHSRRSPR